MDAQLSRWRWLPKGLPSLHGRGWWPFVAVWTLALALAVTAFAMLVSTTLEQTKAPISANGLLGLSIDGEPWVTLGPPEGVEATQSGVRRGDRLIAIDGRPVARNQSGLDRQLTGSIGEKVVITTQSSAGWRTDHLLTRDPIHYQQALAQVGLSPTLYRSVGALSWCVGPLLMLLCAIVLMIRRARDPLAPWASLMMLAMILGTGATGPLVAGLLSGAEIVHAIVNGLAASMLMIVLIVFPDGKFEPRWSVIVAACTTIAMNAGFLTSISGYALAALTMIAAVSVIAVRYRAMPAGNGRQQIRWTLFGFAASVVATAGVALCQAGQAMTDQFGVWAWMSLGVAVSNALIFVFLILGMTISLMRYRLYDADATISRTITYSLLTVSLLAVFAGSEKVIEILGERYFGEQMGVLAGGIAAAVAAVTLAPIHHRVTHWAEHRFRSGLMHLRHGLPLLAADLRETASPQALAATVLERIEQGVRARHGAIIANDNILDARGVRTEVVSAWLTDHTLSVDGHKSAVSKQRDPLFPMRVPLRADGVGLVGWLLLGPRPDGSFFGREEQEALGEIADPIARALAISGERERRNAADRQRQEALSRSVERLQERVQVLRSFILKKFGFDAEVAADVTPSPI